jgi:protein-tyrosine phosphatase
VAAGRGVDISGARAAAFRSELAGRADLVLTMTREHVAEVLGKAPEVRSKTFTLKEAVAVFDALPPPDDRPDRPALLERIARADELRRSPGAPRVADADVSDPIGLGSDVYRAVAWEVEGLVDSLVKGLFGPVGAEDARAAARDGG